MAQVLATNPNGVYGISDILEAQLRSNRTQTTQSDGLMTKVDRSNLWWFFKQTF